MTDVLLRRGKRHREEQSCKDTETQRESHVKTEAETGVTLPQAKEHLRLPKLEEARKDRPLEALEGAWPQIPLDVRLSLQNCEAKSFGCFRPASLG